MNSSPEIVHRDARDPRKVLNHLELARYQVRVAQRLGLHRDATDPEWHEANREILARHIERKCATDDAIARIARNACLSGSDLSEVEAIRLLLAHYRVAQAEFHPSDICNESCKGCTYGFDTPDKPAPVMFPFDRLHLLADMQPKALLFVGGGEPLLYKDRSTGKRFGDLVLRLRELLPDTQFALITNGTVFPDGLWHQELDWVRLSVDAGTPSTYETFRGKPYFDRVCGNLLRFLNETGVPRVGVGFVFCRDNVAEAPEAARFFYNLVRRNCSDALPRFNIQYRPLRRDPAHFGRPFPEAITQEQIAQVEHDFARLQADDSEFARFLSQQTNCEALGFGNRHREAEFERCGYSQLFRIVRANGDIRPCCLRLSEPEFDLGNVLRDRPETISLNTLYNAAYLRPGCDAKGCKLGGTNHLIELGLAGHEAPSTTAGVTNDYFFG